MLPKVVLFNSISLDGRMEGPADEALMGVYYGLAAQCQPDAKLAGSETILAGLGEQPPLELEEASAPKELHPLAVPYLVLVDSRARIHAWRYLQVQPYWKDVLVLCSSSTPHAYLDELEANRVKYIVSGADKVDFRHALQELSDRFGIQKIRVDSGGRLNGVLLRAGLVDEVSVLVWPKLVGGETPSSIFTAPDLERPEQLISLKLIHCETIQNGLLWLRYEILH